jgi:predicted dithiol-disulfide oxidoreductase (DUF899 family)
MGWKHRWLSSLESDFNYDYGVSFEKDDARPYNYDQKGHAGELPGLSVFLRDGDAIFHTYSTYGRGLDILINTYNYVDLTPLGRQEEPGKGMRWVKLHDQYEA